MNSSRCSGPCPLVFPSTILVLCATAAPSSAQALRDWIPSWELDVSYERSHWVPGKIEGAEYDTTGANILSAELDLSNKLTGLIFLPKGTKLEYMWTPGGDPDLQQQLKEDVVQGRVSEPSFVRLFAGQSLVGGMLDEEEDDDVFLSMDLDYEAFAFASNVELDEDKAYRPRSGGVEQLEAGDVISTRTLFRKWSLVASLTTSTKRNLQEGLYLGFFKLDYRKPYALTISTIQDPTTILDTKFDVFGLTHGWKWTRDLSEDNDGGVILEYGYGADLGYADVKFSGGETLNDQLLLNEDILYTGLTGDVSLSSKLAGGLSWFAAAGFRYHNFAKSVDGQAQSTIGVPDINEDVVYFASAGLNWSF